MQSSLLRHRIERSAGCASLAALRCQQPALQAVRMYSSLPFSSVGKQPPSQSPWTQLGRQQQHRAYSSFGNRQEYPGAGIFFRSPMDATSGTPGSSVTLSGAIRARDMHSSPVHESAVLAAIGVGVAATAVAARYALRAYERTKQPTEAPSASEIGGEQAAGSPDGDGATGAAKPEEKTPPPAASKGGFFGAQAMARRFYRGGFEDKMTRREAALILGVRESATPERIRERHRRLLVLNHPDMGGSSYIATKINEAKELLLKGSR